MEFERACIAYGMHLMTLSMTLSQMKDITETPAFDVFLHALKETSTSMAYGSLTKEEVSAFSASLGILLQVGGAQLAEINFQKMLKSLAALQQ